MPSAPVSEVEYYLPDGRKWWDSFYSSSQDPPRPPEYPLGVELRSEIGDLRTPKGKKARVYVNSLKGSDSDAIVRKTPAVCGGEARIRDSRIMVWLLVSFMREGMTDAEVLANYPTLTADDLNAAREYYREHPDEIDEAIAANECDNDEDA
jgi:uncharacterized protein (DUF433 family)